MPDLNGQILEAINARPGQKAKDIASNLGVDRNAVNSALYGKLKGNVQRDQKYCWFPRNASVPPSQEKTKTQNKTNQESASPAPSQEKKRVRNESSRVAASSAPSQEKKNVHKESHQVHPNSDLLSKLIGALGLEIAAIRKQGGSTKIEVRGGERIGQAGENWLYRFPFGENANIRDETPVKFTCGVQETNGVLVSLRDGVLVVSLESDLGEKIAYASLVIDDSYLVERLRKRLEEVRSGVAQFNKVAAERVFGEVKIRNGDSEPNPIVYQGNKLNEEQCNAIRRSLGSDTTFVWGPPGTGKTSTLARIVEAHYREGRTVLIVSNTNIAVDTALEKVADRLCNETEFNDEAVLRQGTVLKDDFRNKYGQSVILEEVVKRLGEKLHLEKEDFLRQISFLECDERSFTQAIADLEHIEAARRCLAETEMAIAKVRILRLSRKEEIGKHHSRAVELRVDFERARSMGAVRRFFTGLDPERIQQELSKTTRSEQSASQDFDNLQTEERKLEETIRERTEKIELLNRPLTSFPSLLSCRGQLKAIQEKLLTTRNSISQIDQKLAALTDEVLQRCRILATTVYKTYLGKKTHSFDVVVIDEASMMMLPLVYYAAGLATHSVIIAGDFRQLPAIVKSDEPVAEEWLKRDIFEKAGIPDRLHARSEIPELVSLRTQYRMREPICKVVNQFFYPDHPLSTDPSANTVTSRFPLGEAPLLYVDTTPFQPWAALRLGTYSRYNLFHALLVRNIVLHLAETGYLPEVGQTNGALGVVTPYGAQSKLIQALINDRLGDRAAGVAATVHRYQGNEKDTMLLDLTDSFGTKLSRFLSASRINELGARLLNVAVSRARHHVLVVANFDFLRSKSPGDAIVRNMLNYFEENGKAISIDSLLSDADRDWLDALHYLTPLGFDLPDRAAGAFTEGTFYPAFEHDLANVKSSLVIFSPFATTVGTGRWVELFRAALARGVAIRVAMCPPSEIGGGTTEEVEELVQKLRSLGVAVDLRSRMHEKIAILDGRILWHGSLNIFSHRRTHESMLRIESASVCELLGRFVSTPTSKKENRVNLHAQENPICPDCGGQTIWNTGRFGIYFVCEKSDCGGKVDPLRRGQRSNRPKDPESRNSQPENYTRRKCSKSGCDGQLILRSSRFGHFFGCTRYPNCRYTEKSK